MTPQVYQNDKDGNDSNALHSPIDGISEISQSRNVSKSHLATVNQNDLLNPEQKSPLTEANLRKLQIQDEKIKKMEA